MKKIVFALLLIALLPSFFIAADNFRSNEFLDTVADIEGHVYRTIKIGTQVWMIENLKTTKFNDGKDIIQANKDNFWDSKPNFCWYDFDIKHKAKYGALYNGYAVITNKLCPAGWRVPTLDDWIILIKFLDPEFDPSSPIGMNSAAKKMKTVEYWEYGVESTNQSGFSAVPGGYRSYSGMGGIFFEMVYEAYYWSSTKSLYSSDLLSLQLLGISDSAIIGPKNPQYGLSVRCIRN